ncbi:hypothetical protein ACFWBS_38345 [Streptomyces mirabilis]|uniref:hypothetical protein n=1 Tax=Streptomyces mirabilis TaxID=68239 RepID=UPI00365BA26D
MGKHQFQVITVNVVLLTLAVVVAWGASARTPSDGLRMRSATTWPFAPAERSMSPGVPS